jgi:hypothetical protein
MPGFIRSAFRFQSGEAGVNAKDAKWTFMVYMAGFNNLSTAATEDLEEMRSVGSTDDVKIAVFVKRLDRQGAERIIVGKDGQGEKQEQLSEADSGSPQTLLDFVRWATKEAPAERYALVVWNHGSGWQVDDLDEIYSDVRSRGGGGEGVTARELGVRSTQQLGRALFKPAVEQVLELPTMGERAIASDDGTGHSLDTIELRKVLEKAREELRRPLDVLGMDACLMSTLEVAYEAQDYTGVVTGSEELEPGDGWPYERILADLVAEPDMDGKELGRRIVKRYVDSYAKQKGQWPVTQCAVATAGISGFADKLDALATALRDALQGEVGVAHVLRAHKRSPRFIGELVDLRVFCRNLAASGLGDDVKAAARRVVDALAPGDYVLAEGHHGPTVEQVGGVTAYLPPPTEELSQFYADLRFAKERGWDEFITDYQRA